jgi:AcrR family transcriptional regulator
VESSAVETVIISHVPSASTRSPRLPPEVRRRQILDSTAAVVVRDGFGSLTIDAVAREAKITRPVVYDQFGDLTGLLDAFLADVEARAMAAAGDALPDPDSDEPPDKLLEQSMRTFLGAVRSDPDLWRIVLIPPEGTPAESRGLVDQRRSELAADTAKLIDGVCQRHSLLPGVDREVLARVLIGIAEDMGRLVLRKPRQFGAERIARATGEIARLLPQERGAS